VTTNYYNHMVTLVAKYFKEFSEKNSNPPIIFK